MNKRYLLGLIVLLIVSTVLNSYNLFHDRSEKPAISQSSTIESSVLASEQEEWESQTTEDIYSVLDTYVNSPQIIPQAPIFEQQLTFVAEMRGEPIKVESSDATLAGESYIAVYLLRNQNKPIYLNISTIEREYWPQDGDRLRIRGVPIGYLYAIHENQRIDILDMRATSIEKKVDTTIAAAEETIETNEYKITIADTEMTYDAFGNQTLIIYYTFKNKKTAIAASPIRTYFSFTQGEEKLTHTVLADTNEELDSSALSIELLEPNAELMYYSALKLIEKGVPVEMSMYDDEYNLLNRLEISLSEAK